MPDIFSNEEEGLKRVIRLLGGRKTLGSDLKTQYDAHDLLSLGLPARALLALLRNLIVLQHEPSLNKAIDISVRTIHRRKANPEKLLNRTQSGRTWKFAEILAHATEVFGCQEEAELWMGRPAIGLNNRRPIDLLVTTAGAEMVEEFLARLDYGVYV